jgi:hypothetical protein
VDQRFDRGLPFRELLFGLRKLLDIPGGVLKGDELAAAGQRDWIVERALPTPWVLYAKRSALSCVKER